MGRRPKGPYAAAAPSSASLPTSEELYEAWPVQRGGFKLTDLRVANTLRLNHPRRRGNRVLRPCHDPVSPPLRDDAVSILRRRHAFDSAELLVEAGLRPEARSEHRLDNRLVGIVAQQPLGLLDAKAIHAA